MAKVLSQSGDSLADVYDVEGSIAGIEDLLSKDVNLVHEMGATIFSERLSSRIFSLNTGAILQNIQFDIGFSVTETSRLLGLQLVSTNASRIAHLQVSITSPVGVDNSDLPIFFWSSADVTEIRTANILIDGSLQTLGVLIPPMIPIVPNLLIGFDSPRPGSTLTLRGLTNGFGAGSVTIRALLYIAFPQIAGLSSRGLPIPGW